MPFYARAQRIHKPGVPARVEQPASAPAKDVFLRHYEQNLDEREARKASGLSRHDLAEARATDAGFDDRCRELEQELVDKLEVRLHQMARDDPATLRWALERLRPEKYGNRQRLDINVRDVSKLSDEELDAYIAQCKGSAARR
jgi:hypothetical protein